MKRNPNYIISNLFETKEHTLLTRKECIIQFPKRYVERKMADIGVGTFVFGFLIIIMEDQYSVMTVPSLFKTNPSRISTVTIDEVEYYNFHYAAGGVVFENTQVVKKDALIYNMMEEFILKGNVPWYLSYEDLAKAFDKAKAYAGSDVAKNYAILEAITAFLSRSKKDRTIQYRHSVNTLQEVQKSPPDYIGLYGNVFYAAPGTVNKLAGSYFQDAIVSALVQPSDNINHVEQILRA